MPSKHKRNLMRGDSWTYGGVERRDFRASHDGPEVTGPPRKRPGKGMCKRNKGNKHQLAYFPTTTALWWQHMYKCVHCGKRVYSVNWINKRTDELYWG